MTLLKKPTNPAMNDSSCLGFFSFSRYDYRLSIYRKNSLIWFGQKDPWRDIFLTNDLIFVRRNFYFSVIWLEKKSSA